MRQGPTGLLLAVVLSIVASFALGPAAPVAWGTGSVVGAPVHSVIPGPSPPQSTPTSAPELTHAIASLSAGNGPAQGRSVTCKLESGSGAQCVLPGARPLVLSPASASTGSLPVSGARSAAPHPTVAPPALAWINVTSQISYAGSPSTYFSNLAFDPLLGSVLLFGGCNLYACPDPEIWSYSGQTWHNLTGTFSTQPSPRLGAEMAYDPLLGGIVVYGGQNNTAMLLDTWLYTGTWTNLTASVGIPNLSGNSFAGMAWDPAEQGLVLVDGCAALSSCGAIWSGTWVLNNTGWNSLGAGPGFLGYLQVVYDSVDGYLVAFGGYNGTGSVNTTSTFSGGAWTDISEEDAGCFIIICFTPPARYLDSMTWDAQLGLVFMTGGFNASTTSLYNDSWEFVGGHWFPADFIFGPAEPAGYAPVFGMAMDVNSSTVAPFIVGGLCNLGCFDHYWVWELPPALANVTLSPNPVDDNGQIGVTGTSMAAYGSGPVQWFVVSWGDGWATYGMNTLSNFTSNWTFTDPYVYGDHSPPGIYGIAAYSQDYFGVIGPAYDFNVTVNSNLTLSVVGTPTQIEAGSSVSFTATVGQGTPPYTINWTFGDGSTGTGSSTTHTYTAAGTFTANATATDAGAGSIVRSQTITVLPALGATAQSTYLAVDAGVSITFTGAGTGGSGTYTAYNWSFGDGAISHGASASHFYSVPGTYHVKFNVTDSLGYLANASLTIVVNGALTASPTATPASTTTGTNVSFTAGAGAGTTPYTYSWRFGDGTSSSSATPSHAFTTAGNYTVHLWVNDSGGGSVAKTLTVTITAPPSTGGTGLSSSVLGLPLWLWIVLLVVIVVAILGAVLALRRRRPPASPSTMGPPAPVAAPPPAPAGPSSGSGGPPPGAMG